MQDARIFATQDGSHSIFSEYYGVPYHSRYGAIQESEHVFLKMGLAARIHDLAELRIFELGFGTGLNCALSWAMAARLQKPLYYETVETVPLAMEDIKRLNYPTQIADLSADQFLQLHSCDWGSPQVIDPHLTLHKQQSAIETTVLSGKYDLVYFDAFAPSSQPELWEVGIFEKLFDAMNPQGILVTYCAKGVVKRALKSVGFQVEGVPGPPGKREMTRAIKP